jgi:hypothetical protein
MLVLPDDAQQNRRHHLRPGRTDQRQLLTALGAT